MSGTKIVFDLFCGLGGWSQAFIAEGYRAIGFDIEKHDYGNGGYPGELVLRDIRSITGAELVKQYGFPTVIVASPPCQEFSYMAMPWSKAKEKMRKILADPAEQTRLTDLFNQCFRIQREVSAVAGHYVPLIVENVRGAQCWVGKARWNFGSFYLWGDVPALMPIPGKSILKYGMICAQELKAKTGASRVTLRDGMKGEGNKTVGMNWSDQSKRGQDFTRIAGQQAVKVASESGRRTDIGNGTRFTSRDCGIEGEKGFKNKSRFNRATGKIVPGGIGDMSDFSSKSSARKKASAEIAKIPPTLATWIAKTFSCDR